MATRGQLIREHRARKNMTTLQCATRAGTTRAVWESVENEETAPPELRAFLDKFTDGDVAISAWP